MKELQKADVVVIGAGPGGSTAAREIAKNRFNVLLLERAKYPGEKNTCGGGLTSDTLKELDESIKSKVIEKRIVGSIYYMPWKTLVDPCKSDCPFFNVQRRVFDNFLAKEAVKRGARLLTSTRAIDVKRKDGMITVLVKNQKTGEKDNIQARIAIFADGPGTLAFRKLGIGFEKRPNTTAVAMVREVKWEDNPLNHNEFYYDPNVSTWGYGWIFPYKDRVNVGVYCLLSKAKQNSRAYLDYLFRKHPIASKKLDGREILHSSGALIPYRHAKKIYENSALVVGDAAGTINISWGEGIRYAISSGRLSAEIAVKALEKADFSERFLSQYEKEWKKTEEYKTLRKSSILSNIFLEYSRLDNFAYCKLREYIIQRNNTNIIMALFKAITRFGV